MEREGKYLQHLQNSSPTRFLPRFASTFHRRLYRLFLSDDGWGPEGGRRYGYGKVKGPGFFRAAGFAEANDVSKERPELSAEWTCMLHQPSSGHRKKQRTREMLEQQAHGPDFLVRQRSIYSIFRVQKEPLRHKLSRQRIFLILGRCFVAVATTHIVYRLEGGTFGGCSSPCSFLFFAAGRGLRHSIQWKNL